MSEYPADSSRRNRAWAWLPWLVLVSGIPCAIVLSLAMRDEVDNVARLRFERQAGDAKAVIEDRVHSYADVLYGLKAYFATEDRVTRLEFHRFVAALDLRRRYPGFDTVNYARYVPGPERARFEQSVRQDYSLDPHGDPGFTIRPPGIRDEYWVVAFAEPRTGANSAIGLDLGASPDIPEPDRLLASLRTGRDTGLLTGSGVPVQLRTRPGEQGVFMRLAVYRTGAVLDTVEQRRAAYLGSVGAGFSVTSLMQGVLTDEIAPYVRFRVSDTGPAGSVPAPESGERLLYDSAGAATGVPAGDATQEFTRVLPLEVAGRIWQVRFSAPKSAVAGQIDRRLPLIVLLTVLLMTALLFGVLYSLASSRSRAEAMALGMTRDLQASTRQLQAMSRRLVNVQEAERRHFSREFHDQIGQNLTALGINIDILKTELAQTASERNLARLDKVAELVDATASAIDDVISDLRPPMLDDYGLLPALQWYGTEFGLRTGMQINVAGDEHAPRIPPAAEIALFRIAQEALNNAAKHARASFVDVMVERSQAQCSLCITDNGVGYERAGASAARRHRGLGMVTMRERTQSVNGVFEYGPGPQGGFRIMVRVPC